MIRKLLLALGLVGLLLSPAKAADSTVSAMSAASALGGTEVGYLVQGGADRKATPRQYATYMESLIGGDCTISADSIVCTKTNGTSFSALATTTPGTGVATFLATPSSANLLAALTTKTGTGSAVFGTSPTFTTGVTFGFLTGVAAQCLHVDTSGVLSGTGSDCGSSGGSGTVTSVATSCGNTGGPITTSGTISAALTSRTVSGTSDTILAADCGNIVYYSSASSIAITQPAPSGSFVAGFFTTICTTGAGTATVTPGSGNIGGAGTYALPGGGSAAAPVCATYQSDGTNFNLVPNFNINASLLSTGTLPSGRIGALGTPSSGTLTNATGLPISTGVSGLGTGVATAAAANLSAAGGITTTIASGTSALGTSAISSAACATVVTTTATNTATTDVVLASFNGDPTAVTGYVPLTTGMLTIIAYPTSGNVNFKVCNNTGSSITPGAITLNWRVVR